MASKPNENRTHPTKKKDRQVSHRMELQTTITSSMTVSGCGLHTGRMVEVTLRPADANTGIQFIRTDLTPNVTIPALCSHMGECTRSTMIRVGEASVVTLEHLMSALLGMGVDNAIVEINGPEVPILDGSARTWVEAIRKAGVTNLNESRAYYIIKEKVTSEDADSKTRYTAEPADDFQVRCLVDYPGIAIGKQEAIFNDFGTYATEVANCRTFVFLHEIMPLLENNLIKGGALDNALVYVNEPIAPVQAERLAKFYGRDASEINVESGVLNTVKPYFENEPARHKMLDFLGDIFLLGHRVKGHFTIECPGHKNNVLFASKLINNKHIILNKE